MKKNKFSFIVNIGSTSKKYALFNNKTEQIFHAIFEKNSCTYLTIQASKKPKKSVSISAQQYSQSILCLLNILKKKKIIEHNNEIGSIGLRIVAPGTYFCKTHRIDDSYKKKLSHIKTSAPIHILPLLTEIDQLNRLLPNTPIVAVSDSSFHMSIPSYARHYAIAQHDSYNLDIYHFGYHGISVQSIIRKLEKRQGCLPKKLIICHLGGGSSITAVKNGTSIDTSMGFSPLDGIPMGTRVGSIDPGALIFLAQKHAYSLDKLNNYLNTACGLLGVSKKSSDMRELLALEKQGDPNAQLAISLFIYSIQKYIGAYTTILHGIDLLLFTGMIGQASSTIRSRICRGLAALNIEIDENKNRTLSSDGGYLQHSTSEVKIAAFPTDEMNEIALQTKYFLSK